LGCAAEMMASKVDLPAFGTPRMPTSDSSFRSRTSLASWPFCPLCAIRGAWLVDVAKRAFPLPPRPPRATTNVSPASVRSPTRARSPPSLLDRTSVPTGTRITKSFPRRPCLSEPRPCCPRSALQWRRRPTSQSVLRDKSARRITRPPAPPSPPSGPPCGTNFSRRKLITPEPPSPPPTKISARSIIVVHLWTLYFDKALSLNTFRSSS